MCNNEVPRWFPISFRVFNLSHAVVDVELLVFVSLSLINEIEFRQQWAWLFLCQMCPELE